MKNAWMSVMLAGGLFWAWSGAAWGAVDDVPEGVFVEEAAAEEEEWPEISEEALRREVGDEAAARRLMARVRSGVPSQPLGMEATIKALSAEGRTIGRMRAQVTYRPDTTDPSVREAVYAVLSPDGREEAAVMSIRLPSGEGGAPVFRYECPPGTAAEVPDLFAPLEGTDLCWMELSFSFLFWARPRIVGTEVLRKRWTCQIVELEAPEGMAGAGGAAGWDRLRLWVAPAYGAVVQGVALRGGEEVKRFEVESVTRVRHTYMVSDMLVRSVGKGTRSRLKIGGLELLAPEYTPEQRAVMDAPVAW